MSRPKSITTTIATTHTPSGNERKEPISPLRLSPTIQPAPFTTIVDGLQQRELLAPCLLLSAGYVGVPFFVRQALLLLSPVLALFGLPAKELPRGSR